jgi:hypothetical protein
MRWFFFSGSDETACREKKGEGGQIPFVECIWVAADGATLIIVPLAYVAYERTCGYIN